MRKHLGVIAISVSLLLAASTVASLGRSLRRNSLAAHTAWESSKSSLARHVMGADAFLAEQQPIARNRLDLSAWFGFQEVLYRQSVTLTQLEASVQFEPDGYVMVLYDVREDGFSGVRLSNRADLPTVQFRAQPNGKFTAVQPINAAIAPGVTHRVTIRFEPTTATVVVDGLSIGRFDRTDGPQRIGFRGGQRKAWVDDIKLMLADGSVVREGFADTRNVAKRALLFFALVAGAITTIGILVHRAFAVSARMIEMWTVLISMGLVAAAVGVYAFQYLSPKYYPDVAFVIKRVEFSTMALERREARERLLRDYPVPAPDNAYRILFLGSSQTWGAGAATLDQVWVPQLERLLNADGRKQRIECMNAGVSGLASTQVKTLLTDVLPVRPQAAVINLSNNDVDTVVFRATLDSMVVVLQQAHVQPVLLLEANSPERRLTDSRHGDLTIKHRIVTEIGSARGVPVLDMHHHLEQMNPTGFLWWDFVHLSSYGQRVMAEKLHSDLPALLHLR